MLEFWKDLRRMLWGAGRENRLPDCEAILFLVRSSVKLDPRAAARYIALCRLTGLALVVRYISWAVFLATVALALARSNRTILALACTACIAGVTIFGMLARLSAMLARGLTDGREGGNAL